MNENKDNRKRYTNALLFGLLLILIFNAVIMPMLNNQPVKDTEYSFFLEQIEDGNVSKVEITDNEVSFQTKDDQKYSTVRIDDPDLVERLNDKGDIEFTGVSSQQSPLQSFLFAWVLPLIFLFAALPAFSKTGFEFGIGSGYTFYGDSATKDRNKELGDTNQTILAMDALFLIPVTVNLTDIAGCDKTVDVIFLDVIHQVGKLILG